MVLLRKIPCRERKLCLQDLKPIIAKNISDLRQASGMTQIELAEKLNYSDKAVSKWERAESVPDISVLKQITDLFGVTLDYLVTEDHTERSKETIPDKKRIFTNHTFITCISVALVWLIATTIYVVIESVLKNLSAQPDFIFPIHLLSFIYAIPISMIVWLVFNSIWFNHRLNFLIVSLLMWSAIAAIYLTLLPFAINVWLIFLLGIPGQVIILMWSKIRRRKS